MDSPRHCIKRSGGSPKCYTLLNLNDYYFKNHNNFTLRLSCFWFFRIELAWNGWMLAIGQKLTLREFYVWIYYVCWIIDCIIWCRLGSTLVFGLLVSVYSIFFYARVAYFLVGAGFYFFEITFFVTFATREAVLRWVANIRDSFLRGVTNFDFRWVTKDLREALATLAFTIGFFEFIMCRVVVFLRPCFSIVIPASPIYMYFFWPSLWCSRQKIGVELLF